MSTCVAPVWLNDPLVHDSVTLQFTEDVLLATDTLLSVSVIFTVIAMQNHLP
jgi:hypothetical protein